MIAERAFPGTPESVRESRTWLRAVANEAALPRGTIEDAVLVLSELVTNTIRHTVSGTPGGKYLVKLTLAAGGTGIRIEVTDQGGPGEPVLDRNLCGDPLSLAEHGRGLALVELFAPRWRVRGDATGRTITASVQTPTTSPTD
jgi:serine/threonine-protein kinase RsbW